MRKVSGEIIVQNRVLSHHMEKSANWNVLAQKKFVIMSTVAKILQVLSYMQNINAIKIFIVTLLCWVFALNNMLTYLYTFVLT